METPPSPEIHGFFLRWAPCEPTESGLPPAPVTVNCFPCDPYGMPWKAAVASPRRSLSPERRPFRRYRSLPRSRTPERLISSGERGFQF